MSMPAPLTIYPSPVSAAASRTRGVPRAVRALGSGVAGFVVVLATALAGIGWLYTLRKTGALDAGPRLHEALPLQRLAGDAAQPVLRLVVAWLPAGLVAGLALRAVGFRHRVVRVLWAFALTAVLLGAAGAASDAITASESLGRHLSAQPGRVAIWLAAALVAAGAAIPRSRR